MDHTAHTAAEILQAYAAWAAILDSTKNHAVHPAYTAEQKALRRAYSDAADALETWAIIEASPGGMVMLRESPTGERLRHSIGRWGSESVAMP